MRSMSQRIYEETSLTNVCDFDDLTIVPLFNNKDNNRKVKSMDEVCIKNLPITWDMLINTQHKDRTMQIFQSC